MATSAIASIILAACEPRLRYVYWGSVVLAAPGISYGMLSPAPIEMGGFVHALMAGVFAVPFWYLFDYLRKRKRERMAERSAGGNAATPRASA